MENQIWHFPSTDGGIIDGINDAGIETFEGDRENSLARECIQNSLDARDISIESPVCVKFERFEMAVSDIPGYEVLKDAMGKAKNFSQIQDNAKYLYETAIEMLTKADISVLKISDYNTIGLTGNDDADQNGGWYKLVRATGVNSMTGDGGGSYGIGKGAPFATSALRTIFYSTLNKNGGVFFQGNTRLSSFEDAQGDIRRGIGQFGEEKTGKKGVCSIRDKNNIPKIFQRDRQGTDIFVIGYSPKDSDWVRSLLASVLDNFWMAIHEGILQVEIINLGISLKIDNNNLDSLINEFASDDENTKLFYKAMIEPTKKFEYEIPLLGKVDFFVRLGEGPKHVQCMRRSLMKVHTMGRLRVMPDDFVGVFIARGLNANKFLRNLEPPAHDMWDIKRGKYDEDKKAYEDIRNWIVESLRSLAGERDKIPEEIPDLSRYLPEDIECDNSNNSSSNFGSHSLENSNRETFDQVSIEKKDIANLTSNIIERTPIIKPASASDEPADRRGTKKIIKKDKKRKGATDNPDGKTRYIDTSRIDIRIYEANRNGKRVYIVNILPDKDESGAIKIIAYADDSVYEIDINHVKDQNGKAYEVVNSEIRNLELKSGQKIQLILELTSNRRYVLGVE